MSALRPTDPALALAQRLADHRRDSATLELLDHLDTLSGTRAPERLRLSARLAARQRDSASLLSLGQELADLEGPHSNQGLLYQVSALNLTGDTASARARLSDHLTRHPTAAVALRLAELELSQGDSNAAREALRRLPVTMSIDQRVRALILEAASFRRDGAHAKALNALRTAVNLKPNDVNLRLNFVKTLERAGLLEEALREIVFCRDKSPRDQDLEHIESIEKRIQKKQSQRVHSARKKSLGID